MLLEKDLKVSQLYPDTLSEQVSYSNSTNSINQHHVSTELCSNFSASSLDYNNSGFTTTFPTFEYPTCAPTLKYDNTANSTILQYTRLEITKEMLTSMNNDMIKIKDVEILVPNKVVQVTFDDDSFEKAICHEEDNFNLETAITVCIAKHLIGSSSKFNNLVSKTLKRYENKIKEEQKAKEEQERYEAKRKKNYEEMKKRIAKKEKEAKEERINELAEAFSRALAKKSLED